MGKKVMSKRKERIISGQDGFLCGGKEWQHFYHTDDLNCADLEISLTVKRSLSWNRLKQ